MKTIRKILIVLLVAAFLGVTAIGCENEGPAEKTGKKIDEAIDKATEKIDDTVSDDGPAENIGEKIDDTIQKIDEKTQ